MGSRSPLEEPEQRQRDCPENPDGHRPGGGWSSVFLHPRTRPSLDRGAQSREQKPSHDQPGDHRRHTAAILLGFFGLSPENSLKLKLGLDLRSGTHITLRLLEVKAPRPGRSCGSTNRSATAAFSSYPAPERCLRRAQTHLLPTIGLWPASPAKNPRRDRMRVADFWRRPRTWSRRPAGWIQGEAPGGRGREWRTRMDGRYIAKASVAKQGRATTRGIEFQMTSKGTRVFGV